MSLFSIFVVVVFIIDGALGGTCSSSIPCSDLDARCPSGICLCQIEYSNVNEVCRKGIFSL